MDHVEISKTVIDSILTHARVSYPDEGILLLRGKATKQLIIVDSVVLPPLAIRNRHQTSFPLGLLPIDYAIVGTAHSHPSGTLEPSVTDLNSFYGKVMVIVAYPFDSEADLACFDRSGKKTKYEMRV